MTLDDVLADAFRCLAGGVIDHASPFHTLGAATVTADGTPDVRILVLRSFDVDHAKQSVAEIASRTGLSRAATRRGHRAWKRTEPKASSPRP